jgi:predicted small lipoprotein YifL
MRRLILAWTTLGVALTLLAGCGTKGTLKPNTPPDTRIFVQGPVDTVNHNVHLYWFGTDVDGAITGFEIRLRNPAAPADSCWMYVPADSTDGTFSVYSPDGFTAPVFEVRAIDDSGEQPPSGTEACPPDTTPRYGTRDPSPARQSFKFSNLPPTVTLVNRHRMADTTYGSVTLNWSASDPDGDGTKLRFFVWLDGNEGSKNLVAGSSFTIPTAQFLQDGVLKTGPRWMKIQAIDDGGMVSTIDSTQWMVRSPGSGGRLPNTGRLLLIDDQPANWGRNSQNYTADTLYYNTAARNLLPEQYSLLQLEYNSPFRSSADLLQTFRQFDAVVWYIGGVDVLWVNWTTRNTLAAYQDAIGSYLESGGSLYLEGLNLIDTPLAHGPLRSDFMTSYLGSDFLFRNQVGVVRSDSSADWSIQKNDKLVTLQGDSLRFGSAIANGLRCFGVRNASYGIVWAPNLPVSSPSLPPVDILPFSVPVAVSVPQASGGRCVMVTFPLQQTSNTNPAYRIYQNSHKFLAKVFDQLELTTP